MAAVALYMKQYVGELVAVEDDRHWQNVDWEGGLTYCCSQRRTADPGKNEKMHPSPASVSVASRLTFPHSELTFMHAAGADHPRTSDRAATGVKGVLKGPYL